MLTPGSGSRADDDGQYLDIKRSAWIRYEVP
jgi:hypothetical protein